MWGIILIAGGAVLGFFVLRGVVFLAQDIIYYKRKEREGSEAGAGKPNKVNNEDINLEIVNNEAVNKKDFDPKQ